MSAKSKPLEKYQVIAQGDPYPVPPMIRSKAIAHAKHLLKSTKLRRGFDEVVIRRVVKDISAMTTTREQKEDA